jgi:hypothetical protein
MPNRPSPNEYQLRDSQSREVPMQLHRNWANHSFKKQSEKEKVA